MYAADWDGFAPIAWFFPAEGGFHPWGIRLTLLGYLPGGEEDFHRGSPVGDSVLLCPAIPLGPGWGQMYGQVIPHNRNFWAYHPRIDGIEPMTGRPPSEMPFFVCSHAVTSPNQIAFAFMRGTSPLPFAVHQGRANVAFRDGRVKSISAGDLIDTYGFLHVFE